MTGSTQLYSRPSYYDNTGAGPPPYGKYYGYSSGPPLSYSEKARKTRAALQSQNPGPRMQRNNSRPCQNNHATNIRTRGAHEFYNMMWDPSVYRGNSYKTYQAAEAERCLKKRREDDPLLSKKRKYPRQPKKIGGILRPTVHIETEKIGFGDMGIQTEHFLEELTSETAMKDMCTQVEAGIEVREIGLPLKPFSIGKHMDCQTDREFSCPFEENVQLIQEQLSIKILEQSILETSEEAALEVLRKDKRGYIQGRQEELLKLHRQIEAKKTVTEERAAALKIREREARFEAEAEYRLGATLFSSGCVASLVPSTFESMKQEGFMSGAKSKDIQDKLNPVLNNDVTEYLQNKKLASRKILDELLSVVAAQREGKTKTKIARKKTSFNFGSFSSYSSYSTYGEGESEETPSYTPNTL